ncbi:DUF1372 family protein [Streptococcus sp. OH4692_COT-348]|uniref:DUF1372 family protein n=1 Tax=Streptococcus sp. OH4692_COT-348 TaxID=2491052 RepID=UPI000F5E3558|nr:DUF1372 family protein [Streptococcus sp. OH4692_COT-348]RRD33238.1 DUF1372 family protein [Streptococcus sp. OH4692_COT-348]
MKNKNRVGLFFALAALSLSMLNLGLIISKNHYKPQVVKLEQQVEELKNRKPVIIYQVDNAGGELIGTVTDKAIVDGHYTVTIGAYGKFLVTKEQYESINIGDDAPGYLKK